MNREKNTLFYGKLLKIFEEDKLMNVAKFIRILGYLVYTILWLPVIVLHVTIAPAMCIGLCIRSGKSVKKCFKQIKRSLVEDCAHDLAFIQTGKW